MGTYDMPVGANFVKWAIFLALAGAVGGFIGRMLWPHQSLK